jgi:hypothetical protein
MNKILLLAAIVAIRKSESTHIPIATQFQIDLKLF